MALSDPPGRTGFPLIGETFAFLRDHYGFTRQRVKKNGPVFQTSLLGRAIRANIKSAIFPRMPGDRR